MTMQLCSSRVYVFDAQTYGYGARCRVPAYLDAITSFGVFGG
jgi:hypothetical protein